MLRFEDLRVRDKQTLDRDFFNRRYRLIAESIGQIDAQLGVVTEATNRLVALGLSRINEVLGPALTQVQAAAENGFLVATSTTPLTLSVGLETTLLVDDTPARPLFAPTPYVVLSRQAEATADDWALLRIQDYNRANGGLAFEVVAISGDLASSEHADWTISASAGLAASILEAAIGVAETLTLAEGAATTAQSAAAAASQIIGNGPVASVNGKTGLVSLVMGDIPNLVTALGGKADSSHGHSIAQISNLQSTITAIQSSITALQAAISSPDGGSY